MRCEKCNFCENDRGPLKGRLDECKRCDHASNFKVKTRMTAFEAHKYAELVAEEDWINDDSVEFDRDTALAVLKAISKHMHASHDRFGDPTLVISRDRFEAVRKKFLDTKKGEKL